MFQHICFYYYLFGSTILTILSTFSFGSNFGRFSVSLLALISSICFLKDILTNTSFSSKNVKEKIRKTFHSILLFYFIITKYQYKYIIKHKTGIKFFNISTKPARNDLKLCSIFLIFTEVIKDKTGNSILPLSKLDDLSISQFIGIIELLDAYI